MNESLKKDKLNKDILAACFLAVTVMTIFLPAIFGWQGIFRDDMATEFFPQRYFFAKNLQHGVIPLWNPHIWCGAIPYYARYYHCVYYIYNWPFYLAANLNNLDQAFLALYIIPFWSQLLFAAIGIYIFLRRILKCGYIASCLGALVYIYSPYFMRI